MGKTLVIALEIGDQQFHGFLASKLEGRCLAALLLAIKDKGCQPLQLGSQTVHHQFGTIREERRTLLQRRTAERTLQLHSSIFGLHQLHLGTLAIVLEQLDIGFQSGQLGLVVGQQLLPSLILGIAATDRDTTLLRLHTVGIVVAIACQIDQFAVVAKALFEQRHGSIQVGHILRPLIAQHLGRRLHLPAEGIGKGTVATHIILHTR